MPAQVGVADASFPVDRVVVFDETICAIPVTVVVSGGGVIVCPTKLQQSLVAWAWKEIPSRVAAIAQRQLSEVHGLGASEAPAKERSTGMTSFMIAAAKSALNVFESFS
jgi:hypothetical protein